MISPVDIIFSVLTETTPPRIKSIAVIDINGSNFSIRRTNALNSELIATPNAIGSITTCTIDIIIAENETDNHSPANHNVSNGVTSGANNVEAIVIDTDSATSPRAKYVITFDDVPPGQVPTNITPTASSAGKSNAFAISHANIGIIVNCANTPINTSRGRFNTNRKSSGLSVMPIPNIAALNKIVTCGVAQRNVQGMNRAIAVTIKTNSAMYFDTKALIFNRILMLILFFGDLQRVGKIERAGVQRPPDHYAAYTVRLMRLQRFDVLKRAHAARRYHH